LTESPAIFSGVCTAIRPSSFLEDFFDEEESNSKSVSSEWSNIYKELKNRGIISIDVEDESSIDADRFIELQEEEIEARLEETIQAFMEELDEDGKAFLKFKKEGGNTKDFFKIYSEISEVPTPEYNDEKSQEKFLRYYCC
jgi:S-adenosylmethionine:tRNA-ribosyltransferase-isomerase (queuine synthetase)